MPASGGKTYAELDRVVSFGVAAMAMGLGLLPALVGYALLLIAKQLAPPSPDDAREAAAP